jgi:hypothetical protein
LDVCAVLPNEDSDHQGVRAIHVMEFLHWVLSR